MRAIELSRVSYIFIVGVWIVPLNGVLARIPLPESGIDLGVRPLDILRLLDKVSRALRLYKVNIGVCL